MCRMSLWFLSTGFSMCGVFWDNVEDMRLCWLNGVTFTVENLCDYISDTSDYRVPSLYDSACRTYPELSSSEKEEILHWLEKVFRKRTILTYKWYLPAFEIRATLSKELFWLLSERLLKEYNKWYDQADLYKMARYHYAARLIGYDYDFPNRELFDEESE